MKQLISSLLFTEKTELWKWNKFKLNQKRNNSRFRSYKIQMTQTLMVEKKCWTRLLIEKTATFYFISFYLLRFLLRDSFVRILIIIYSKKMCIAPLYICIICGALYHTRVNEENAWSKWENKCTSKQHGQIGKIRLLLHPRFRMADLPILWELQSAALLFDVEKEKNNNPVIIYLHAAKVTPTTMKCSLFKSKHTNTRRTDAVDIIESIFHIHSSYVQKDTYECIQVPKICHLNAFSFIS